MLITFINFSNFVACKHRNQPHILTANAGIILRKNCTNFVENSIFHGSDSTTNRFHRRIRYRNERVLEVKTISNFQCLDFEKWRNEYNILGKLVGRNLNFCTNILQLLRNYIWMQSTCYVLICVRTYARYSLLKH